MGNLYFPCFMKFILAFSNGEDSHYPYVGTKDIIRTTKTTHTTISQVVKFLIGKGYVERYVLPTPGRSKPRNDARLRYYKLTPKGVSMLGVLRGINNEIIDFTREKHKEVCNESVCEY